MELPRVLIFGHAFNKKHGGGITLSNLFRGWPGDRIAVVATGHAMYSLSTDVCQTFYQLGSDEFSWRFPLNFLQKKFPSGIIDTDKNLLQSSGRSKSGLRYALVNKYFYPILEWFGIYHAASSIRISKGLSRWLEDYRPQVLYLMVSTRETIAFAQRLCENIKTPAVIHMMDDWPSTISKRGPFKRYWQKRIDKEFRQLLDSTDLCLSISKAMSDEYRVRYNREFIPFHNPIDVDFWLPSQKHNFTIKGEYVKILYSGRIGRGISQSVLDLALAISEINAAQTKVRLHIQSTSADPDIIRRLREFSFVVINPVAEYHELPKIYSDADILVIINDFDNDSVKFLRYSMPTKASEFMISGTPILVYSHREAAISKFFIEHNCGCCVTENDQKKLRDAIISLIDDKAYRKELSSNAVRVASNHFEGGKVRREFQQSLSRLIFNS